MRRGAAVTLAVRVAVVLTLAACSSSSPAATASHAGAPARTLNIVAGENFWGSIVSQLAGKAGNVTSVISDPNADPHSFESSSDGARAFAGADFVVLNGAGYDSWASKLLSGNPNSKRMVLSVADLLGKKEGDNPHFWYNPDYVAKVTDRIQSDLKNLDPADASYFDGQRAAFDNATRPYASTLAAIKATYSSTPVASTESIVVYLTQYLGLDLISPSGFMQAVSEGNDPPAASVALFQQQITTKQAKVLLYNSQTSTAVTTNMKNLAGRAGVVTVPVTETVDPRQATFEQWFTGELTSLQAALSAARADGQRS
jgi:zinc/manganese transport system substrate-binding protein